jgi:hypothetical protein
MASTTFWQRRVRERQAPRDPRVPRDLAAAQQVPLERRVPQDRLELRARLARRSRGRLDPRERPDRQGPVVGRLALQGQLDLQDPQDPPARLALHRRLPVQQDLRALRSLDPQVHAAQQGPRELPEFREAQPAPQVRRAPRLRALRDPRVLPARRAPLAPQVLRVQRDPQVRLGRLVLRDRREPQVLRVRRGLDLQDRPDLRVQRDPRGVRRDLRGLSARLDQVEGLLAPPDPPGPRAQPALQEPRALPDRRTSSCFNLAAARPETCTRRGLHSTRPRV